MASVPQPNLAATNKARCRALSEKKRGLKENEKRFLDFRKRRERIMKKTCELSVQYNAQSALIVFSPNDDEGVYTCGNPNPESVIHRYLSVGGSSLSRSGDRDTQKKISQYSEEYEFAKKRLKEEKKRLASITASRNGGFWWDQSIEEMSLKDLEAFAESLKELKVRLKNKLMTRDMVMQESLMSLPAPLLPPASLPSPSFTPASLPSRSFTPASLSSSSFTPASLPSSSFTLPSLTPPSFTPPSLPSSSFIPALLPSPFLPQPSFPPPSPPSSWFTTPSLPSPFLPPPSFPPPSLPSPSFPPPLSPSLSEVFGLLESMSPEDLAIDW